MTCYSWNNYYGDSPTTHQLQAGLCPGPLTTCCSFSSGPSLYCSQPPGTLALFLPLIHVCVPPSRPSPAIRVPENPQVPGPVQPSAWTTCKPLWCSLSLPSTGGVGIWVLLPEAQCKASLSELLVHLLRSSRLTCLWSYTTTSPVSSPQLSALRGLHPIATHHHVGSWATLTRQRRRTMGAWPWGSLVSPCFPSSRTSGQNAWQSKRSHQLGTTPRSARAPSSEGGMPGTNVPDGRVHTHWRASSGRRARSPASPAYRSRLCGSRAARRVARLAGKKCLSARAPPASG